MPCQTKPRCGAATSRVRRLGKRCHRQSMERLSDACQRDVSRGISCARSLARDLSSVRGWWPTPAQAAPQGALRATRSGQSHLNWLPTVGCPSLMGTQTQLVALSPRVPAYPLHVSATRRSATTLTHKDVWQSSTGRSSNQSAPPACRLALPAIAVLGARPAVRIFRAAPQSYKCRRHIWVSSAMARCTNTACGLRHRPQLHVFLRLKGSSASPSVGAGATTLCFSDPTPPSVVPECACGSEFRKEANCVLWHNASCGDTWAPARMQAPPTPPRRISHCSRWRVRVRLL